MRFVVLVACGILLSLSPVRAGETAYLSTMEDVPLLPGLFEVPEEGMVFDQPEGRIVLAVARCESCGEEVASYYGGLLPALGWQTEDASGGLVFLRDGERLVIDVQAAVDGGSVVSFTLAPGGM
ncbi:MAG: hypothetical protein A2018_07700 [Alphaproteobacteria bacterium GWF2_58_20]|nr:MAG: hypothetical protein A2018_07700 [Alphaproteobacteria bacterium GWF2_58_20]